MIGSPLKTHGDDNFEVWVFLSYIGVVKFAKRIKI